MGDEEEEFAHCIRVVNEVTAPGANYRPMSAVIQEQRALAREQGVASVRAKFEVVGAVNQKLMAKLAAIELECANTGDTLGDTGDHFNGDRVPCVTVANLRRILGGEP